MSIDQERFMRVALEEAVKARDKGNIAVGAVLVRVGRILARGRNEVNSSFDITAHAETATIRKLSKRLHIVNPSSLANAGLLDDCTLYTTVEPCPMCCWAICIAGISTIVIGARLAQIGVRWGEYTIEKLIAITGRKIKLTSGILGKECAALRLSGKYAPGAR